MTKPNDIRPPYVNSWDIFQTDFDYDFISATGTVPRSWGPSKLICLVKELVFFQLIALTFANR